MTDRSQDRRCVPGAGVSDGCYELRGDAHVRLDRNGPDLDLFHVFHGLTSASKDAIVADVASALAARRAATSVVRWNPGDVFSPGVGAK
jgi:hypothetical protein